MAGRAGAKKIGTGQVVLSINMKNIGEVTNSLQSRNTSKFPADEETAVRAREISRF